jgi:hypothetical protein
MKKLIGYSSGLALAALMTGCVATNGPVAGSIYTDVWGADSGGDSTGSSKMGEASAQGILGFATGDASIKTAAANGGITKIQHVDHHNESILGVWAKSTTIVYGE